MTSKYKIKPFSTKSKTKSAKNTADTDDAQASDAPGASTATFSLKTYDPVSGVCLQYETNKAAEVGRLIAGLGRLGRSMAAMQGEHMEVDILAAEEDAAPAQKIQTNGAASKPQPAQPQDHSKQGTGGGGGKKKKKGKK